MNRQRAIIAGTDLQPGDVIGMRGGKAVAITPGDIADFVEPGHYDALETLAAWALWKFGGSRSALPCGLRLSSAGRHIEERRLSSRKAMDFRPRILLDLCFETPGDQLMHSTTVELRPQHFGFAEGAYLEILRELASCLESKIIPIAERLSRRVRVAQALSGPLASEWQAYRHRVPGSRRALALALRRTIPGTMRAFPGVGDP